MTWLVHRPRALGRLRRSRLAALVGIAVIVLQSALTVAHAMPLSAADGAGTPFWGSTARVLCALGARDVPSDSRHHAVPACPLCQVIQHLGAWLPPAGGWVPLDPPSTLVVLAPPTPLPSTRTTITGIRARAPPARI